MDVQILCSATGKLAEESSMADRIRLGLEFKVCVFKDKGEIVKLEDYLDKANAMCQDSYEMLHMRDRFHYHVRFTLPP